MLANLLSWSTWYTPNIVHPLAPIFQDSHANDLLSLIAAFLDGHEVNVFARINTNTNSFFSKYKKQIYLQLLHNEYKIDVDATVRELFSLYWKKKRFEKSKWASHAKVNVTVIPIKTKTKPKDVPLSSCFFLPKRSQRSFSRTTLTGDERWSHEVLTNDAPYILFSHFHDGSIHLLNAKTHKIEKSYAGHTSTVLDVQPMCYSQNHITSSPVGLGQQLNVQSMNTSSSLFNDRLISSSNDKTIRVWNMMNGLCMAVLTGHSSAVYSVRCSYDLKNAISGSHDKSIRLWDLQTGTCVQAIENAHDSIIYGVRYDGYSTAVSCGKDGLVKVWDVRDSVQEVQSYAVKDSENADAPVPVYCMDICDNVIAFGDKMGTLRFMDKRNMQVLKEYIGEGEQTSFSRLVIDPVKCVCVGVENIIKVYDTTTMELVRYGVTTEQQASVTSSFCLSVGENAHVDDQYLLTADAEGNLCLLDFLA
jgi:WD40 repeat protein